MYAMRYGAVPIVTPVGGLRDTVEPLDAAHGKGTGLVAAGADASLLLIACEDALGVWRDPVAWPSLVARAMARDSSWVKSAERYREIYSELVGGDGR
jgi:starch synthase